MKIFRNLAILLSLVHLSLSGCEKNEMTLDNKVTLESCEWPLSYSNNDAFKVKNWEGLVKRYVSEAHGTEHYFLDFPNRLTIFLDPCNLPDEVKMDGLIVKVSGNVMTYPGIELQNLLALPFELTFLEYNLNSKSKQ